MRHSALRIVVPVSLSLLALGLTLWAHHLRSWAESPYPIARTLPYHPLVVERNPDPELDLEAAEHRLPRRGALARGETLGELLATFGLDPAAAIEVAGTVAEHVDLRRLRAGDPYTAYVDEDNALQALELEFPARGRVRIEREAEGWHGRWQAARRSTVLRTVRGEVAGAFESAVTRGGAPSSMAYSFAEVFRWDIDFNRDLRLGDRFRALYELIYLDGKPASTGRILAASYAGDRRDLQAYRFEDGYYDSNGRPLKKMFLRAPLKFNRISSGFSHRRYHPVLKRYRPHYGVDYAAPTGTPVQVTASGVVESAGAAGGAGNMVKVRHPNGYITAYLHLSRFASGIRSGARVQQGDVIGYVGATGLATGPHLDYRVQKDGTWIDPLSIDNVLAAPISESRMAEFVAWRDQLLATLDSTESMESQDQRLLAAVLSALEASEATALSGGS